MSQLAVVILAAGQGTRMKSALPKVLHRLAGRPLLEHVVSAASRLDPEQIFVVYGHGGEMLRESLPDLPVEWVLQDEQHGTGHAVEQAMPQIEDDAIVLVLYGDVPLVKAATIRDVATQANDTSLCLLSVTLDDATGYGRILRNSDGAVTGIVEQKDANEAERRIREINTGIMAAPAGRLRSWLSALESNNVQGEFYLTDVIALAVAEGLTVHTVSPEAVEQVLGVNDRVQLAQLERYYQSREAERLMRGGVTLHDPARFDVRGEVVAAEDVTIDVNVVLEGRVVLGRGVSIGPNAVICDSEIGDGTEILANCVIEDAQIGERCRIGPFSRLRPENRLASDVRIGNFVELKKSEIGPGSKVNHLSYVGDSEVGSGVNIGAGTITCNYDGAHKHRTVIGDNAFIGSDAVLIAPLTVGAGAFIAAGSTISNDAPANELTLARARQSTIKGWKRPTKD